MTQGIKWTIFKNRQTRNREEGKEIEQEKLAKERNKETQKRQPNETNQTGLEDAWRDYIGLAEKPRPAALQLIPAGFSC